MHWLIADIGEVDLPLAAYELRIECHGHPAKIRDADLNLKLLVENRFSAIWLPAKELRDLRALLWHRHPWVCMRPRVQNALQAIALANAGRNRVNLFRTQVQD